MRLHSFSLTVVAFIFPVFSGCSFDDAGLGPYLCEGAADCPPPRSCVDGYCILAGGSDATTDSSTLPDASDSGPINTDAAPMPCAMEGMPCDDANPCTMGEMCTGGFCSGGLPTDGDSDGYVSAACPGGDDCDDSDFDINPGATEGPSGDPTCSDGDDNDCDGAADGADIICSGAAYTPSNVPDASYWTLGTGTLITMVDCWGGLLTVLNTDTGEITDAVMGNRAPGTGLDAASGIYFEVISQGPGLPDLGVVRPLRSDCGRRRLHREWLEGGRHQCPGDYRQW